MAVSLRSFLDRFVHPWVAAIALAGAGIWLISFGVAAVGVILQETGNGSLLIFQLFFGSGVLGLIGMVILAACGLYLVGVRTKQVLIAA